MRRAAAQSPSPLRSESSFCRFIAVGKPKRSGCCARRTSSLGVTQRARSATAKGGGLVAGIIAAELGDLSRFESAPKLMAYLGLLPSEHSSGESKQRGHITRTGNSHVRRVLVEAAWAYRFRASMSTAIRERNDGVPRLIRDIAWKAQERLHRRYASMSGRDMCKQKTVNCPGTRRATRSCANFGTSSTISTPIASPARPFAAQFGAVQGATRDDSRGPAGRLAERAPGLRSCGAS